MCGIAGIIQSQHQPYPELRCDLRVMDRLIAHRGPDGHGFWADRRASVGFVHRRLSIIDIATGQQPMTDVFGCTITYNGEIYNYRELRQQLASEYPFKTTADTEVILAAYHKWGQDCLSHLRGMFAFALWDEKQQTLFCARDRFGIKPFYYYVAGDVLYFASEIKALVPFLPEVSTNKHALQDYLAFQFCLHGKTLFEGVHELPPAHMLVVSQAGVRLSKYWEVYYEPDFLHTAKYFQENLRALIEESVQLHIRSDVPIGAYVSGGIDSGIISSVASGLGGVEGLMGFTGKFTYGRGYDESAFARAVCEHAEFPLLEVDITSQDFVHSIEKVIYHLDFPVAGPGSFPQYHVSKLASSHRKVVLGGQGGDEIFGGYARYLIAYFEQCIKAAIDGTTHNGQFIVTYESIIPNLGALQAYKPLLKEFWSQGLFEDRDSRYFRLINRANTLDKEIHWENLVGYSPFDSFKEVFHGQNVGKESYFDSMTHFDFKTLLRALLQVEDRMSMAHGVESRVPLIDHRIVEFAATMPANVKFQDGTLKRVLVNSMRDYLPSAVLERKDKMGFPVPLNEWLKGELRDFVYDLFSAGPERPYFNRKAILNSLDGESQFGRKLWGLLSLEIWHQQFHDQADAFRKLRNSDVFPQSSTYDYVRSEA